MFYFGTLFSLPVYNFFDKNNVGRQILTRGDCNCLGIMRGFPGGSDGKDSACNVEDLGSVPGSKRFPGEGIGYPLIFLDFPGGSHGKESACNAGDRGSIPGLGRSPGKRNGNPLQYSCLENSMDRGTYQAIVHGITKGQTRLRD